MSTVRRFSSLTMMMHCGGQLKEQFTLHDEFEINDAATASAGLKQLRSEMVDLVLLDVRLPDMDGQEACKQMRERLSRADRHAHRPGHRGRHHSRARFGGQ